LILWDTRPSSESDASSPPRSQETIANPADVQVLVLGTAQDGGLPHIGCFCPHCRKARGDPRFSRFIVSLGILDPGEGKAFLVDVSPDIREQTWMLAGRFPGKIEKERWVPDGILLTHAHIGHYAGLVFYGYEGQSTHELPVFCSIRMANFLSSNGPWDQMVRRKNLLLRTVESDCPFSLTPRISVTPMQVPHRDEYTDTLAFKIKGPERTLLYIPDIQSWEAWGRSISDEVKAADVSLLDGTFFSPEELPSRDISAIGHPFIEQSVRLLRGAVRESGNRVFFTHLNHTNPVLDRTGLPRKNLEKERFFLAEDGMTFSLGS